MLINIVQATSTASWIYASKVYLLVPGLMSDMSIRGPVFWMRAGWWTDTPVQKLWGFPVWLNSVSVTGIVALSSPANSPGWVLPQQNSMWRSPNTHRSFCLVSPICLMPSLSSISSCTLGMSMCKRGPWGGPFTGVSKLRLFLLLEKRATQKQRPKNEHGNCFYFWKLNMYESCY